jgi:1-acyl-sn-glycerol-3-phosphate acyltransferase
MLVPEDYERLQRVKINDLGFGYDPFGLEIESAMIAYAVAKFVYKNWFRVESHGVENVPQKGPVLITPNHSGVLPFDGAMLAVDLTKNMETPRVMRAVVDNFAGFLPFVNTLFYRWGQIIGARRNFEELLRQGEMVTVFPEGHKGTGKPYRERYKLTRFNVGFMELSLLNKTPIVPTAVIGAEEQYPYMIDLKPVAKLLSFPYMPVTPLMLLLGPLGMIPLPTKYIIYYGKPLHFYRDYPPETVKDPETIYGLVDTVKTNVQDLIDQGLRERKGVFGFPLTPLRALLGGTKKEDLSEERKQIREQAEA